MTTYSDYDEARIDAFGRLDTRVPTAHWPEGERDKAMSDALNNVWVEGLTVEEWVDLAARLLHV